MTKISPVLDCNGKLLSLEQPQVMGILNITPDSFSDGGDFFSPQAALIRAGQMVEEGAAIIDVGGESTRPGATQVSVQEELDRVIPIIEALSIEFPTPVSIDTSKPEVMRAAIAAGAGMINDVRALRIEGALEAAAEINSRISVPVCLMHMAGEPRTMQKKPGYTNVVQEVKSFLENRIRVSIAAGLPRERLLIDPGFGFGKLPENNLLLLKHLNDLMAIGAPLLVGVSRKAMIGTLLDVPVGQRLYGSLGLAVIAVWQGASIIRAHDVLATREAITVCNAVIQTTQDRL